MRGVGLYNQAYTVNKDMTHDEAVEEGQGSPETTEPRLAYYMLGVLQL